MHVPLCIQQIHGDCVIDERNRSIVRTESTRFAMRIYSYILYMYMYESERIVDIFLNRNY